MTNHEQPSRGAACLILLAVAAFLVFIHTKQEPPKPEFRVRWQDMSGKWHDNYVSTWDQLLNHWDEFMHDRKIVDYAPEPQVFVNGKLQQSGGGR